MFWDFTLSELTYNHLLEGVEDSKEPVDQAIKYEVSHVTGDPNPHGLVHVVDNEEKHVITLNIPEQEV